MEEMSKRSIKIAKNAHFSFSKKSSRLGFDSRNDRFSTIYPTSLYSRLHTAKSNDSNYLNSNRPEQRKTFEEVLVGENNTIVEDYNNFLKTISTTHQSFFIKCDWPMINAIEKPFDYENGEIGPKEMRAKNELDIFDKKKLNKILKYFTEKSRSDLLENIIVAKAYDKSDYEKWQRLNTLSKGILDGNIDAYVDVFNDFKPFDDIAEFGSVFFINFIGTKTVDVEFRVNEDSLMPENSYSLNASGHLVEQPFSKIELFEIINSYISSTCIRIARDCFAILPVENVYIHVLKNVTNEVVGIDEISAVVSVKCDRKRIEALDLFNIDPTETLLQFPINRNYKKGEGFKPISRIPKTY